MEGKPDDSCANEGGRCNRMTAKAVNEEEMGSVQGERMLSTEDGIYCNKDKFSACIRHLLGAWMDNVRAANFSFQWSLVQCWLKVTVRWAWWNRNVSGAPQHYVHFSTCRGGLRGLVRGVHGPS
jgi:hypothetical protein